MHARKQSRVQPMLLDYRILCDDDSAVRTGPGKPPSPPSLFEVQLASRLLAQRLLSESETPAIGEQKAMRWQGA